MNSMDIRRGINIAVDKILKELDSLSTDIKTKEEISQVATISANSDKEIGELISTAT